MGPFSAVRALLASQAGGGVLLIAMAALALALANSPLAPAYFATLESKVAGLTVRHWVNDALMALFFLVIGLEIKRELIDGQLASRRRRILPGVAAAGGMLVPALIYAIFNWGQPTLRGWATPTATDIAFALGVLALFGPRVPVSLKIFLTTLAIIDDLGAVLIIAVVYTADLSLGWLALAATTVAVLQGLNRAGVLRLLPYLALGAALWYFFLRSGVHATVAGVALAATIPLRKSPARPDAAASPLHMLEHSLQPLVAFVILPVFALANAGVSLSAPGASVLTAPAPLGIVAGLFVGKQLGVFAATWATVRLGWADRPEGASWTHIYGVSLLCGIGFTMSLFIGLLAFPASPALQDEVKIGVLAGSLLSMLAGAAVLFAAGRSTTSPRHKRA